MNSYTIYKLWAKALEKGMGSHVKLFAKLITEEVAKVPIDMVLHCPACGTLHIDKADEVCEVCGGRPSACNAMGHRVDRSVKWAWLNPPHRSHLCNQCGYIWRPADVPTNGVLAVKTRGQYDMATQAVESTERHPWQGAVLDSMLKSEAHDPGPQEPVVIDGTLFSQRNKAE